MPYRFKCELCGTVTDDADFSGAGHPCECGLVYGVTPTLESVKFVAAREARKARQNVSAESLVFKNGIVESVV